MNPLTMLSAVVFVASSFAIEQYLLPMAAQGMDPMTRSLVSSSIAAEIVDEMGPGENHVYRPPFGGLGGPYGGGTGGPYGGGTGGPYGGGTGGPYGGGNGRPYGGNDRQYDKQFDMVPGFPQRDRAPPFSAMNALPPMMPQFDPNQMQNGPLNFVQPPPANRGPDQGMKDVLLNSHQAIPRSMPSGGGGSQGSSLLQNILTYGTLEMVDLA